MTIDDHIEKILSVFNIRYDRRNIRVQSEGDHDNYMTFLVHILSSDIQFIIRIHRRYEPVNIYIRDDILNLSVTSNYKTPHKRSIITSSSRYFLDSFDDEIFFKMHCDNYTNILEQKIVQNIYSEKMNELFSTLKELKTNIIIRTNTNRLFKDF